MINELRQLIASLEKLNTLLGVELVTSSEISEGKENIDNFENDIKDLRNTINDIEASNLDKHELVKRTIVHLNRYFGDIIQDLQNIQELIDVSAKRYVNYLDLNNEKRK